MSSRAAPDKAIACERFIVHLHRIDCVDEAAVRRLTWLEYASLGISFRKLGKKLFC